MTIDQAIAILNAHEHRWDSTWRKEGDDPEIDRVRADCYKELTFFEAIAVAEKYEREAAHHDQTDEPPSTEDRPLCASS